MKILNNGVEQDVKVLTYFKINNENNLSSEYVIYTDVVNEGENIYVANVFHANDKIRLVKPMPEILGTLKKIISNLISNNPNNFIFSQNKYQYIDIKTLQNVEKVECQKIKLTEEQYRNMVTSNYLTYPFSNMTNVKAPDGFKGKYNALADTISIVVSAILLIIILGGLTAYHFDWNSFKSGVFDFNGIMKSLLRFDLYVHNYLILQIAIFAFLLSLISFSVEKTKPIMVYFTSLIVVIIIYIIWMKANGYIDFNKYFFDSFKILAIYSVFIALILTICYSLCKEVTILITTKFSFCNFISYYTIFFILFTISLIGLGLFYNGYLVEHVEKFISSVIK